MYPTTVDTLALSAQHCSSRTRACPDIDRKAPTSAGYAALGLRGSVRPDGGRQDLHQCSRRASATGWSAPGRSGARAPTTSNEAMLELITQEGLPASSWPHPGSGEAQASCALHESRTKRCDSQLSGTLRLCKQYCFHLRYMSYPSAVFRSSCGGCTWALWRETLLRLMQPHSQQRTLRGVCRPGLLWLHQPGQHRAMLLLAQVCTAADSVPVAALVSCLQDCFHVVA